MSSSSTPAVSGMLSSIRRLLAKAIVPTESFVCFELFEDDILTPSQRYEFKQAKIVQYVTLEYMLVIYRSVIAEKDITFCHNRITCYMPYIR